MCVVEKDVVREREEFAVHVTGANVISNKQGAPSAIKYSHAYLIFIFVFCHVTTITQKLQTLIDVLEEIESKLTFGFSFKFNFDFSAKNRWLLVVAVVPYVIIYFFSLTQIDAPHEWKMALPCTVLKWQLLELVTAPLGFYCFCCYNYSNCFKLMCVRVCPSQRNEWKLRSLRFAWSCHTVN